MSSSYGVVGRNRVMSSGIWTVGGYAVINGARFVGNLLLTRMLFPEAFGLMAIVQSVITAATLLTDIGITPSVIKSDRGAEKRFLDTAWTLQIVRGMLVWWGIAVLAPIVARIYSQPDMLWVLIATASTAAISGFTSTHVALANRNLQLKLVTLLEVGSYCLGLVVTLFLAHVLKNVWALVVGGVVSALCKSLVSHAITKGMRNGFCWDLDVRREIVTYGRWIMMSSCVTFFASEANKLILGAILDLSGMAMVALASALGLVGIQIGQQLATKVLFPVYSNAFRTKGGPVDGIGKLVSRTRLLLLVAIWGFSALCGIFSGDIVGLLYDDRYAEAGKMLGIVALGAMPYAIVGSYGGVFLASGRVSLSVYIELAHAIIQIVLILLGYMLFGKYGALVGMASSYWLIFPGYCLAFYKLRVFQWRLDLPFVLGSMLVSIKIFNDIAVF